MINAQQILFLLLRVLSLGTSQRRGYGVKDLLCQQFRCSPVVPALRLAPGSTVSQKWQEKFSSFLILGISCSLW
jgi:hypothetical protein